MNVLKALAVALFKFFTSDKTPNSSFYVTSGAIITMVTTVLTGTGNPVLMAVGGGLAAVYTIMNNYTEARKTQAAADAFNTTLHASIRLSPPPMPISDITPEAAAALASKVIENVQDAANASDAEKIK